MSRRRRASRWLAASASTLGSLSSGETSRPRASKGAWSKATSARPSRSDAGLVAPPAEQQFGRGPRSAGFVLGQRVGQESGVTVGLERQHEPRTRNAGALGPAGHRLDRGERRRTFLGQHRARRREADVPRRPGQQRHSEALLELANRARQRRLGHPQTLRRPAEMQFLGDREEVAQLARLQQRTHTRRVQIDA